jgi:hypothetical protein
VMLKLNMSLDICNTSREFINACVAHPARPCKVCFDYTTQMCVARLAGLSVWSSHRISSHLNLARPYKPHAYPSRDKKQDSMQKPQDAGQYCIGMEGRSRCWFDLIIMSKFLTSPHLTHPIQHTNQPSPPKKPVCHPHTDQTNRDTEQTVYKREYACRPAETPCLYHG